MAKMMKFHLKISPFASSKCLQNKFFSTILSTVYPYYKNLQNTVSHLFLLLFSFREMTKSEVQRVNHILKEF